MSDSQSMIRPSMRVRALLMERGHTVSSWARSVGVREADARMMTNSRRLLPELRDKLALFLGMSRTELDELIPAPGGLAEDAVDDVADADEVGDSSDPLRRVGT